MIASITGYSVLPFLLFFLAAFLYVLGYLLRDIRFYSKNGWDFSQDSDVPSAWFRIGTTKQTLSKKNSILFGTPLCLLFFGVPLALLVNAFLEGI
jgi:hypothetical protein